MGLGDPTYRVALRTHIEALTGFCFQDFIERLHFRKYGPSGFTNLRPVRDGGCDGLVKNGPDVYAIACYGPDVLIERKFKKKVNGDHVQYKVRWQEAYPEWRVFINRQPSYEQINHVRGFGAYADLWGTERVLELVAQLEWPKRLELCRSVGVEESILGRDMVKSLLDDLLHERIDVGEVERSPVAPAIQAKIKHNYAEDEWGEVENRTQVTVQIQIEIENALSSYDSKDLNVIFHRVITDFESTRHLSCFGRRMWALRLKYCEKYNPHGDDFISLHIDALITHIFNKCLIGVRPPG